MFGSEPITLVSREGRSISNSIRILMTQIRAISILFPSPSICCGRILSYFRGGGAHFVNGCNQGQRQSNLSIRCHKDASPRHFRI
jgi:hypothetical protein